jgi:hypothetical protein
MSARRSRRDNSRNNRGLPGSLGKRVSPMHCNPSLSLSLSLSVGVCVCMCGCVFLSLSLPLFFSLSLWVCVCFSLSLSLSLWVCVCVSLSISCSRDLCKRGYTKPDQLFLSHCGYEYTSIDNVSTTTMIAKLHSTSFPCRFGRASCCRSG